MSEDMVALFDGVLDQERPMDGLMGNGEYAEFEQEKLRDLLGRIAFVSAGSVLDAGCGVGRNVPLLRGAGFAEVVGVDFSERMLGEAAKACPETEFRCADLADLGQFEDGRFDATFAMYVFIHVLEDERLTDVISELERVTKNEIVVGQVMDLKVPSSHTCKIRGIFDMVPMFKAKELDTFWKNYYEIPALDGSMSPGVSMAVFR